MSTAASPAEADYDAPFAGLKVVDLSQGLAAPYCGMLVAQHGADVIKVEPPGGDWSRILNVAYGDHTAFSIAANLGKRSIALDWKAAAGREVLWRLLADADIVIEGFRPDVMPRLGCGYADVAARVPDVLYVSVSGFGDHGPLADKPAMDPVLQAFTGMALANGGDDGTPRRVPISLIDMTTGMYAFQSLAAALFARERRRARGLAPAGRHIKTSLLEGAAQLQIVRLIAAVLDGPDAPVTTPPSGSYQAADGWLQIQVVQEHLWQALCAALEIPAVAFDARFDDRHKRTVNVAALMDLLRPAFRRLTLAEIDRRFTAAGILYERMNTYPEFVRHPHVVATGLVTWLQQAGLPDPYPVPRFPGLPALEPGTARARAPARGEQARAILAGHGYSAAEIAALVASGVVNVPAS